ncbi:hypothetical protein Aca07nite_54200 [Actinoplanes capillaceus]|uniref:Uncharacterized protein n=1 Tax=Actinoplanes campanulatus TaxID=113559 RepID=A0ABQ3WPF5_9ACTN|nr:hypothetical protein [Actinoplanes capillaceus]GID48145.1 hypothetical protein Aca07nite_54200 [Actinoplanes capillaceus]
MSAPSQTPLFVIAWRSSRAGTTAAQTSTATTVLRAANIQRAANIRLTANIQRAANIRLAANIQRAANIRLTANVRLTANGREKDRVEDGLRVDGVRVVQQVCGEWVSSVRPPLTTIAVAVAERLAGIRKVGRERRSQGAVRARAPLPRRRRRGLGQVSRWW